MDFKVIIENIKKGHSYVEIAKQLEIPVTTLKSRCTKEGINFREIRNNRTEKSCPHCKIYKPIVEFYVSKGKISHFLNSNFKSFFSIFHRNHNMMYYNTFINVRTNLYIFYTTNTLSLDKSGSVTFLVYSYLFFKFSNL